MKTMAMNADTPTMLTTKVRRASSSGEYALPMFASSISGGVMRCLRVYRESVTICATTSRMACSSASVLDIARMIAPV